MITLILKTASVDELRKARLYVSDCLHLPLDDVTVPVAVAYVCGHFEMGQLTGWDGFVENIEGSRR